MTTEQVAAAIKRIPSIRLGGDMFLVFTDRMISEHRILQIVPQFDGTNPRTNVFVVSTLDFSSINSVTVMI